MTTSLSLANLGDISSHVAVPAYLRESITAGIVHFGVGNFHRAHQAVYLDALLNPQGRSRLGTDRRRRDRSRQRHARQTEGTDYLTTVVEQSIGKTTARITGAMIGFLDPRDRPSLIEKLADPSIRIVSMTITEGGYSPIPLPEHSIRSIRRSSRTAGTLMIPELFSASFWRD